ncbi:hypothetical protein JCM8547_002990 [Rhodosporidiobolus lusitaniae]
MASAELQGPSNTKFFTKTWTPPAGTPVRAQLLFVHGFVEHIERYDHAFPRFADKGICVFAYDQRGFGRTATYTATKSNGVTSWAQQLEDLEHFLKHAKSLNPTVPLFLFGHSMGGGLSLAFPTRFPPSPLVKELSGVMVSSPLIRQAKGVKAPNVIVKAGSLLGKLSGNWTLKATVKPEDCTRDPAIQKAYAQDPLCVQVGTFRGVADMLLGGLSLLSTDYTHWPSSLPLLIVHGDADKVTDCEASREFVDKVSKAPVSAKDASFKAFEGYYHEMHNEPGDDKFRELDYLVDWVVSHLPSSFTTAAPPAPSSAIAALPTVSEPIAAVDAPKTDPELAARTTEGAERTSKL